MHQKANVTIWRISPRVLWGVMMVVALTAETYLMSRHNNVASGQTVSGSQMLTIQETRAIQSSADHPATTPAAVAVDVTASKVDAESSYDETPASDSNASPLEKLPAAKAALAEPGSNPTAIDRAAVLKAVASLELQSVLTGDAHRSCTINSVKCEENQQIDGFTVETIAPGTVTVRMGIYRFELSVRP